MFSEKSLRIAFVIISLAFLWTLLRINIKTSQLEKELEQKKFLQKKIDSLDDVNFELQIKLFRYERATEILKEKDSIAGSHYSDIISDETE